MLVEELISYDKMYCNVGRAKNIIKSLLERIDSELLIELLPYWQRQYFKSESLIDSKEQLIEYICASAHDMISSNVQLAFLILFMNVDEQEKLMKEVDIKSTFSELVVLIKENRLNKKSIEKVRNYLGIVRLMAPEIPTVSGVFQGPESRFFELLDYQVYVKEQIMSTLINDNEINRVVVHMPTGTGKTKTSMHALVDFYLNHLSQTGLIIWIAHTNTLLEQAEETLFNVWSKLGVNTLNVYRSYDRFDDDIIADSSGVLFIGVQKLISIMKNNANFIELLSNNVKLVFFDEAHKSTAFETKKTIQKLMKYKPGHQKGLIGLTATPGRDASNEIANIDLADFYDRNIITINPLVIEQLRVSQFKAFNQQLSRMSIISYFQERKILAKLVREELEYDDTDIIDQVASIRKVYQGEDLNPEIVRIFSQNINRNKRIVEKIEEIVEKGKQIIVFACSVEHGKFLTSLLQAKKIKASEVYGTTHSAHRIDIINKFRSNEINVLVNCGVLTTGFDSTNINCVFITRPTTSVVLYSQMIGRGLRGPKMGGNEECLLVDMKDNLSRYGNDEETYRYFDEYWG